MIRFNLFSLFLILVSHQIAAQSISNQGILEKVQEGKLLQEDAWLIDPMGDTLYYESFKGKWLIIDYWMQGCRPCIQAFPYLNKLYTSIPKDKIEVIAVFLGKDIQKWKKTEKRYGLEFPSYYAGWTVKNPFLAMNLQMTVGPDGDQKLQSQTPQYVLIDPSGKIIDKNFPKPSSTAFKTRIKDLSH